MNEFSDWTTIQAIPSPPARVAVWADVDGPATAANVNANRFQPRIITRSVIAYLVQHRLDDNGQVVESRTVAAVDECGQLVAAEEAYGDCPLPAFIGTYPSKDDISVADARPTLARVMYRLRRQEAS